MLDPQAYELLDFGRGRKLERFAEVVVDRPDPAAGDGSPARPEFWSDAHARYELYEHGPVAGQRGRWHAQRPLPDPWIAAGDRVHCELKLTDFGHVGLFPEQAPNWDWIAQQVRATKHRPARVLNLFAYTGASTLAAAAAGAEVAHVDAARSIVGWARRNAELSGLNAAPIRWLVEHAPTFCRREVQRGRQYDLVVLDPPGYGHGPAGQPWKLDEHLADLLKVCRELTTANAAVLLTCHAPTYDPPRLGGLLVDAGFASSAVDVDAGDLWLSTRDGRRLHAGAFARVATK